MQCMAYPTTTRSLLPICGFLPGTPPVSGHACKGWEGEVSDACVKPPREIS
jgi:hypothetical protein